MRWTMCTLVLGLLLVGIHRSTAEEPQQQQQQQQKDTAGILECIFEANSVTCASRRMARELDRMELQITGKSSQVPISKVIEESGSLLADGIQAVFGPEEDDSSDDAGTQVEEARKKKFGKKKKKHLHKLLMIAMILKAKIGLLLQMFTAHYQMKIIVIAILSLMINAARFWLDLKKSFKPSKVIYYEHAQHQHHYDHDDDHGVWGRSSDEAPQELAYNAYAPEH